MKVDERVFLIGGPPRVGKSLLAEKLARKLDAHIVSTDSIRHAARKVVDNKDSDLFIINKHNDLSEEEWAKLFYEHPEQVVEEQNRESIAAWPAIKGFINTFQDDNYLHIVEGVALLPALVKDLPIDRRHIIYIVNTDPKHFQNIMSYSNKNPEIDWMSAMDYSQNKIKGQANFVRVMSLYFKEQAKVSGFNCIDLRDQEFESAMESIIQQLTKF